MTNYIGNTVPGDFYRDVDENELLRHGPVPLGRPRKSGPIRSIAWGAFFIGSILIACNWAASKASTNLALLHAPLSPLSAAAPSDLISNKSPSIMYVGTFFGTSNISFSDNSLRDRLAKWIAPGIPPSFIEHSEISPALIPLAENFFKRGGRELLVEVITGERWIPAEKARGPSGIFRIFSPNAEFEPINFSPVLRTNNEQMLEILKQLREIATLNLGSITAVIVPELNFRFSPPAIAKLEELRNSLEAAGIQYVNFGATALQANPLLLTSHQLNGWPSEFAHKLAFELIEKKLVGDAATR